MINKEDKVMYVVEITEDKVDNLIEHMGKGIKYLGKAVECLEELKSHSRMSERYEEDDEDYEEDEHWNERYGNRKRHSGDGRVGMRRSHGGGRYSRY